MNTEPPETLAVEIEFDSSWMRKAACAERPDLPWIEDRPSRAEMRRMQSVCARCPVFAVCEGFTRRVEITGGVWAGVARSGMPGAATSSTVRGWAC